MTGEVTPEETEVGIWRQITGLDVTAVRHKPATEINADGTITATSVWRETTIDGMQCVPCDRVELQIGGIWDDERGIERVLEPNGGVYTMTCDTTSLTLRPLDE